MKVHVCVSKGKFCKNTDTQQALTSAIPLLQRHRQGARTWAEESMHHGYADCDRAVMLNHVIKALIDTLRLNCFVDACVRHPDLGIIRCASEDYSADVPPSRRVPPKPLIFPFRAPANGHEFQLRESWRSEQGAHTYHHPTIEIVCAAVSISGKTRMAA